MKYYLVPQVLREVDPVNQPGFMDYAPDSNVPCRVVQKYAEPERGMIVACTDDDVPEHGEPLDVNDEAIRAILITNGEVL